MDNPYEFDSLDKAIERIKLLESDYEELEKRNKNLCKTLELIEEGNMLMSQAMKVASEALYADLYASF